MFFPLASGSLSLRLRHCGLRLRLRSRGLRLWSRGLRRRPLPAFDVLLRRRPLLSHLRRRPLRLRLWPLLLPLDARAGLRRRGLPNRLLPHLLLLDARSDLLFPLRGLLCMLRRGLTVRLPLGFYLLLRRGALLLARGQSLLTLGLPLRLLLLPQSNLFSLRALPLGHARSPVVRRLRRDARRRRSLLLSRGALLPSVLPFKLLQLASGVSVSAPGLRRKRGHLQASLLIYHGRARTPRRLIRRGLARLVSRLRGRSLSLVPELKLLPPPIFGDCLDAERLRRVRHERRGGGRGARDDARVFQTASNVRRHFKPASPRGRLQRRLTQRVSGQWVEHRSDLRERLRVNPRDHALVDDVAQILHRHDRHRPRRIQVNQLPLHDGRAADVVRLPVRVVVGRHVWVAWAERNPADLVRLRQRQVRHQRGRIGGLRVHGFGNPEPLVVDGGPAPVVIRRVAPRLA